MLYLQGYICLAILNEFLKFKSITMEVKNYGFLGSDVSKGMCNFVFESGNGDQLGSNFQLDDNKEGRQK